MKKKKIAVRRTWKIHPATRVEKDRRKYNRKTEKRRLRTELSST